MLEAWSQCTIQSFKRSTGEYPAELKLFYINNPPEGGIAQLVERLLCKQDVIGSNPVTSTNLNVGIEDVTMVNKTAISTFTIHYS